MECFYGTEDESARRWIQRFERERGMKVDGEKLSPEEWLIEFNILLKGEAADWADNDPLVKSILLDEGMEVATEVHVKTVKDAFIERFKRPEEIRKPIPDIQSMMQEKNESFHKYYQRALDLLKKAGGTDRAENMNPAAESLLGLSVDKFVTGLEDSKLRMRMMKYPFEPRCSLYGAYERVKIEERLFKAKKEAEKAAKKDEELIVLRQFRDYALQNTQIPANLVTQVQRLRDAENGETDIGKAIDLPKAVFQNDDRQNQVRQDRANTDKTQVQYPQLQTPSPPQPPTNRQPPQSQRPGQFQRLTDQQGNFDPRLSQNPYVNGNRIHRHSYANPLCYRCGNIGHFSTACDQPELSRPEQDFLRNIVKIEREQAQAARNAAAAEDSVRRQASAAHQVGWTEPTAIAEQTAQQPEMQSNFFGKPNVETEGPEREPRYVEVTDENANQEQFITAEVFDNTNKRQRMVDEEEDGTPVADTPETIAKRKKAMAKGKGVPKQRKDLVPITARIMKPPINCLEIAQGIEVVMPLTDLAQLSPYFRQELKRLFTQPRKKRAKKGKAAEEPLEPTQGTASQVVNVNTLSQAPETAVAAEDLKMWQSRDRSYKAFGLPSQVWKDEDSKKYHVSRDHVLADQGSEVNMIYPHLLEFLKLETRPIEQLGIRPISMTMANGTTHTIREWVHLYISVAGIKRIIWALVCPSPNGSMGLLLGVPYLSSINAFINIREETITVGDSNKNETQMVLRSPFFQPAAPRIQVSMPSQPAESDSEEESDEESGEDTEGSEDSDEFSEADADFQDVLDTTIKDLPHLFQ